MVFFYNSMGSRTITPEEKCPLTLTQTLIPTGGEFFLGCSCPDTNSMI